MIPFSLLFRPPAIIRNCPVRQWREITLWLKWGLFFSVATIMAKAILVSDPARISYVFSGLEWLNEYHDTLSIPLPLQYALFFIFETLFVVLAWAIKSLWIIFMYRVKEEIYFNETPIAFSIAGASLITNIWHIIPYGTIFAGLHAFILITFISSRINRISIPTACLIGLAGLIPVIY